jgi:hypothetical protein
MNAHHQNRIEDQVDDRIKRLLQQAMPPVDAGAEPRHDLWPSVLRRLDRSAVPYRSLPISVPLLDWALLAGLVALAVVFPATIPVFLYYL